MLVGTARLRFPTWFDLPWLRYPQALKYLQGSSYTSMIEVIYKGSGSRSCFPAWVVLIEMFYAPSRFEVFTRIVVSPQCSRCFTRVVFPACFVVLYKDRASLKVSGNSLCRSSPHGSRYKARDTSFAQGTLTPTLYSVGPGTLKGS